MPLLRLLLFVKAKWIFLFAWSLPLVFPINWFRPHHIAYWQLWRIAHKDCPEKCIAAQDSYNKPHCNRLYKPLWSRFFRLIGTVGWTAQLFVFPPFVVPHK